MSNARQGWNAAQLASERRPVKRKALAPVGVEERPQWDDSCLACGYHNCPSTCIGPERHAVAEHLAKLQKMKAEVSGLNSVARGEVSLVPEPIRRGVHVPYFGWTRPAEPATQLRKMKDEVGCNAPKLCCCDTCWAKLAPAEPALLTYEQAVAACREGKTVKSERGLFYRFYGEVFWARSGPYQKWSGTRFGEEGLGVKHGPVLANRRFQVVP